MTQCVAVGKIPFHLANPKSTFKYNPIHTDDIALAVDSSFQKQKDVKGHIYTLGGDHECSLPDIVEGLK